MRVVCGKGQCVVCLFICSPYHNYLNVMHVADTHILLHEDKIDSLIVIKRVVVAVILNFIPKSFWRCIYIKSYKERLSPSSTTKLNYPWKWWSFYFLKSIFSYYARLGGITWFLFNEFKMTFDCGCDGFYRSVLNILSIVLLTCVPIL